VCRGFLRRDESGIRKLHERRLERAPSEVHDKRLDEHELARKLRQCRPPADADGGVLRTHFPLLPYRKRPAQTRLAGAGTNGATDPL
jgi:hypothetical protein